MLHKVARSAVPRDGVSTVCTSRNWAAIEALVPVLLRLYFILFAPNFVHIFLSI
jgi:hypothetical protein